MLCGYFSDPLRFKRFPLTPSFHCKRKDKASQSSSGCPMREAKNPQLEMAKQPQIKRRIQANMSLFHFISLAEQSSHCNRRQAAVCFPKSKPKTTPKRRIHFHHDTRPLKTRLVTLPPLQTKTHGGTTSGSGGGGKTSEMWWWLWWWWRENNRNVAVVVVERKQ